MPRRAFVSHGMRGDEPHVWDVIRRTLEPCVNTHDIKLVDLQREPRSGPLDEEIRKEIVQADLVIVVLTLRDGGVPPWIEWEAREATDRHKQLLVYCHQDVPDDRVPLCIGPLHYRQKFAVHRRTGEATSELVLDDAAGVLHSFCDAVGKLAANPVTGTLDVQRELRGRLVQDLVVGTICTGYPTPVPWDTVVRGVTCLSEQVASRRPEFRPDLIVGINTAGLMAAALVQAELGNRFCPVGAVVTTAVRGDEAPRRDYAYSLPAQRTDLDGQLRDVDPREVRSILVVDGQIKTGQTARIVIDHLKTRYPRTSVCLAILCACGVPPLRDHPQAGGVTRLDELVHGPRGGDDRGPAVVPDFLAFVTEGTILLPKGLN